MRRHALPLIAGLVTFLMVATGGVAYALWSTQAEQDISASAAEIGVTMVGTNAAIGLTAGYNEGDDLYSNAGAITVTNDGTRDAWYAVVATVAVQSVVGLQDVVRFGGYVVNQVEDCVATSAPAQTLASGSAEISSLALSQVQLAPGASVVVCLETWLPEAEIAPFGNTYLDLEISSHLRYTAYADPVVQQTWTTGTLSEDAVTVRQNVITQDLAPALAGPALGRAATYSVLGSADTNTGMTTISGDVGAFPTVAVTGFSDGTVQGETHAGDAAAAGAQLDLVAAYADLARRVPDTEFAGDQAGALFLPGVHHTGAAFALSAGGVVTLDAQNDPNAVFIFQVGGALNTAAGSVIRLINGAQASQVFWQSDGAAGTGANSSFSGTIISNGAITLGAGGLLIGRALAMGAATTLAHNTIRFTAALPPTIDITGGATVTTSTRAPVISGTTTAMAGNGISLTFGSQTLVTKVGIDGGWSVASSVIGPGILTAFVRVRDAAGNAATAAQSVTVE